MATGSPGSRPVLLGVALLASAVLAGGAALVLVNVAGDKGTTTATGSSLPGAAVATPSESPASAPLVIPTDSPTVTAAPVPTATATTTSAATPTPAASARASASTSPTPRPTSAGPVTRYPYPANPGTAAGLTFTASSQPQGYSTETVLTISAKDGDGDITFGGLTWGDGTSLAPEAVPGTCPAYPSPTAAPGPYQAKGDSRTFTFRHTYAERRAYTINLTVRSGNDTCRPHGPAAESESAALDVRFAGPSPTPSAAAE